MPRPNDPPSPSQLRRLRKVVHALATARGWEEPWAYVKLCAHVLGAEERGEPNRLTSGECERLIAARLSEMPT